MTTQEAPEKRGSRAGLWRWNNDPVGAAAAARVGLVSNLGHVQLRTSPGVRARPGAPAHVGAAGNQLASADHAG